MSVSRRLVPESSFCSVGSGVEPAGVVTDVEATRLGVSKPSSRFSLPPALDGRAGLRSLPALAPRRSGVADTSRDPVGFSSRVASWL